MPNDSASFLTVEKAAAMLGIGRTLAYEAVRRGEIPCIRIGRIIRVPKAALDRLQSERTLARKER